VEVKIIFVRYLPIDFIAPFLHSGRLILHYYNALPFNKVFNQFLFFFEGIGIGVVVATCKDKTEQR
jgi:hypothetical protein